MCTWLLQLGIFILFNILVRIQIFNTIEYYLAATSCTLTLHAIIKKIMNIIFTDEFVSTLRKGKYFERKQIELISTSPNSERFRNQLEKIIKKFPSGKRDELINKIRSLDDETSLAAISELLAYEFIQRLFDKNSIQIEPVLKEVDNKTPDFFVENEMVFEVTTLFEKINTSWHDIVETINTIKTDFRVMLSVNNIPADKRIKLKEIKNQFIKLFEDNRELEQIKNFNFQSKEGVILSGTISKGKTGNPTVGAVSTSYGFNSPDTIDYVKTARKKINKKISKYKKITNFGYPLVIIVYNSNKWIHDYEWDEIIYGDDVNNLNEENDEKVEKRKRNGIIIPHKSSSVSAILISSRNEPGKFLFFCNKNAKQPLSKEIIQRAKNYLIK